MVVDYLVGLRSRHLHAADQPQRFRRCGRVGARVCGCGARPFLRPLRSAAACRLGLGERRGVLSTKATAATMTRTTRMTRLKTTTTTTTTRTTTAGTAATTQTTTTAALTRPTTTTTRPTPTINWTKKTPTTATTTTRITAKTRTVPCSGQGRQRRRAATSGTWRM